MALVECPICHCSVKNLSSHSKSKKHQKKATVRRLNKVAILPADLKGVIGSFLDVLSTVCFHPNLIEIKAETKYWLYKHQRLTQWMDIIHSNIRSDKDVIRMKQSLYKPKDDDDYLLQQRSFKYDELVIDKEIYLRESKAPQNKLTLDQWFEQNDKITVMLNHR